MKSAVLLAVLLAACTSGDDPLGLEQRMKDQKREAVEARQRAEQEMMHKQEEAQRAAAERDKARALAEQQRAEREAAERERIEELERAEVQRRLDLVRQHPEDIHGPGHGPSARPSRTAAKCPPDDPLCTPPPKPR